MPRLVPTPRSPPGVLFPYPCAEPRPTVTSSAFDGGAARVPAVVLYPSSARAADPRNPARASAPSQRLVLPIGFVIWQPSCVVRNKSSDSGITIPIQETDRLRAVRRLLPGE